MQMSPDQFQQLMRVLQAAPVAASSFNWVQGAMALGATLVSVTGVVVGMRYSIAALGRQLEALSSNYHDIVEQMRRSERETALRLASMAEKIAVLQYAMGVESKVDPASIGSS